MKKIRLLILTVCVFSLFVFSVSVAESPATLTVSGSAVVTVAADGCVLRLGVETNDADVTAAQRENARKMDAVISALKNLGAAEDDLTTSDLNVYSYTVYETDPSGREIHTETYHVGNTLSVTVRDISRAGEWIDAGIAAGANQLYGLTFTASDSAEAYKKALEDACADAFAKARVTAAACGVTLGAIQEIRLPDTFGTVSDSRNMYKTEQTADTAYGTYVRSGDISVSAGVQIVWLIIQADPALSP